MLAGIPQAVLVYVGRDVVSFCLERVARISHRNGQPALSEHAQVVHAVAEHDNILVRDMVQLLYLSNAALLFFRFIMYQAGDYIVYGTSGVCRVDEVKPSPFEDEADRQYYTLTPVTGTETIYIPVDSPVFMRPVISREQAETLVRDIPNIEVDHFTSHSMRLSSEHYQEVLQSHDCGDLVQLIKTVYAKSRRSGRRLSQVDQRYRKRAEELLHGELSVALGIPFHEVPAYIESVIGKPGKRTKKAAPAAEASSAEEKE